MSRLPIVLLVLGAAACGGSRPAASSRTAVPAPSAAPSAPAAPARTYTGIRSEQAVGSYARGREAELQFCYLEFGLKDNPSLAGRITIDITVAESGDVVESQIVHRSWSGSGVKKTESCILSRIQRWKFTESGEGEMTYPVAFHFSR